MAHRRIAGPVPRLVGKPFFGEGSQEGEAEKTKAELQRFLNLLVSASDQAQVDIGILEELLLAMLGQDSLPDPPDPAGLHLFHLAGA